MAQLKAARAADVPSAGGADPLGLTSDCCWFRGGAVVPAAARGEGQRPPLVVVGHRGSGMNALASPDERLRGGVRENTLRSFNAAARCPGVDYVEFDVQVTKDGCPVIFHDIFIYTQEENGEISEKRVTDLRLDEFLSYGPQRDATANGKVRAGGKPLLRKLKEDGRVVPWAVPSDSDDALCTLRDAFEGVDRRVGFNVELKFDDDAAYTEAELARALRAVLEVVFEHAAGDGRPVIFSSFQPDAARLVRSLQDTYPVYFLTKGGTEVFADPRRNSLDAAVGLCLAAGLQGVVSEVRAVLRHPSAVAQIKEAGLALLTYGHLNNVPEVVYVQHLMGVDGVIVDLVREIADAVSAFIMATAPESSSSGSEDGKQQLVETKEITAGDAELRLLPPAGGPFPAQETHPRARAVASLLPLNLSSGGKLMGN